MDSATALSIIAAIALLAVVVVLLVRGRKPQLPTERRPPTKPLAPPAPADKLPSAEKPAAPVAQARGEEAARPAAPSAEAAARAERAVAEQPTAAVEAPAPTAPATAARAAELDSVAHEQAIIAIRQGLANTRGGFIARLAKLFGGKQEIDKSLLEEIEEVLITADLGVRTTERIINELRAQMQRGELRDEQSVWACIRAQAQAILDIDSAPIKLDSKPTIMMMIGVNGVGKTTTIGKLASRYVGEGKKVLLAAGDTYRAAAVLQLEMWGKRTGCTVVKGKENADPSAVIFEAIKRAREESFDVVIADTAGRLHTKAPLMEELKKIERTILKATDGRPADEVFLVLDATTGQNAVQQMKMFREALSTTGVVLTKLDGTAKGGVILGIVDQHKIPVRFIGLGERVEDLREFDPRTFVEALFAKPAETTMAA
jgi:fused signal recognition particle receptor